MAVKFDDIAKTDIKTMNGCFALKHMSYDLFGESSTFQKAMNRILRFLHVKWLMVYLSDIIVMVATFKEHLGKSAEGRLYNYLK